MEFQKIDFQKKRFFIFQKSVVQTMDFSNIGFKKRFLQKNCFLYKKKLLFFYSKLIAVHNPGSGSKLGKNSPSGSKFNVFCMFWHSIN